MNSSRPNHIAAIRKARGLSQQQLAEAVGAHWVTISRLERGHLQLNEAWLSKLASALNVNVAELVNWFPGGNSIYLKGEIGNTVGVYPYECEKNYNLPVFPGEEFVGNWYIFNDDTAWPSFKKGDLIKFVQTLAKNSNGMLCLVSKNEGKGFIFGYLEAESLPGKYLVRPINGPPISGITVETVLSAVEVRYAVPWALAGGE